MKAEKIRSVRKAKIAARSRRRAVIPDLKRSSLKRLDEKSVLQLRKWLNAKYQSTDSSQKYAKRLARMRLAQVDRYLEHD